MSEPLGLTKIRISAGFSRNLCDLSTSREDLSLPINVRLESISFVTILKHLILFLAYTDVILYVGTFIHLIINVSFSKIHVYK